MGNDGKPLFLSNNAGGILGGISTGQPIVARFAVKPTSSILIPRRTVDRYGRETEISTTGRHDPCVGIRAVPIGEAMVACVVADHYLRQRGQVGGPPAWPLPAAAALTCAKRLTSFAAIMLTHKHAERRCVGSDGIPAACGNN